MKIIKEMNWQFGELLRSSQKRAWKALKKMSIEADRHNELHNTCLCWQALYNFESVANYNLQPERTNLMIADIIRLDKESFVKMYDEQYYDEISFLIK